MFAITNTHSTSPPVVGWVLDGVKVATYPTPEEAERAMNRYRKRPGYSWRGCRLEVVEYKEGRK